MKLFRADLHNHTSLSPCGSLENTPAIIVQIAKASGLDIIGITDHNSALQAPLVRELGEELGVFVLCGIEVTTEEGVHCLAFFEDTPTLLEFSEFIYPRILNIPHDEEKYSPQIAIDRNGNIVAQPQKLLNSPTDLSLDDLEREIHHRNGLFIPAHIDRSYFSLTSQLGFVPPNLNFDALEITRFTTKSAIIQRFPFLRNATFIQSSDAHHPENLAATYTEFYMKKPSFQEIKLALKGVGGRGVRLKR